MLPTMFQAKDVMLEQSSTIHFRKVLFNSNELSIFAFSFVLCSSAK